MLKRPLIEEYPEYTRSFINLVPEGEITDILASQSDDTYTLLSNLTEAEANYRYAEGKWSLSEVVGHLTDTERIMGYRLLRISRGDQTLLPGYSENDYVKEASFHLRSLTELLEDYKLVRRSTISLMKGIPQHAWGRKGSANGYEITARALPFMIAGHELHHMKIIKEKYLKI